MGLDAAGVLSFFALAFFFAVILGHFYNVWEGQEEERGGKRGEKKGGKGPPLR